MPSRKYASVKFDADFVEAARQEAHLLHRSVAGQIEHWAALGRAIEKTGGFTLDRVRAALTGEFSVDDLADAEQEAFFDLLDEHFDRPSPAAEQFFAARRTTGGGVGRDEQGRLVRALPGGGSEAID
jgi:hypothetical protein